MELDTFISETFKSIIKGVKDAQEFAKENGAYINPAHNSQYVNDDVNFRHANVTRSKTKIEFDIAVTVSSQQDKGAEGGIKIFSVSVGGKVGSIANNEVVSRLKFTLDIALPASGT